MGDLPGCWLRGCLTPWLDQQASRGCVHPRSGLTSAAGDPGKSPPHGWAIVLPSWVPPLSRLGSAGRAGAALLSNLDSLEVKSEPWGRLGIEKLSGDQKGDGQMNHPGSTLSVWVQALELHHVMV